MPSPLFHSIVAKLAKYEPLGKRFECPAMLKDMAKSGKTFYGS